MGFIEWLKSKFAPKPSIKGPYADLVNWGPLAYPIKGKMVCESHYATKNEIFYKSAKFPASNIDSIESHCQASLAYLRTFFPNQTITYDEVYNAPYKKQWTPANDGGVNYFGQGARGDVKPTVQEEVWQGNMYFRKVPSPNERFKITNPVNGRQVIVQMGYEVGPGGKDFKGGLVPEVHWYLGSNNNTELIVEKTVDNAELGPLFDKGEKLITEDLLRSELVTMWTMWEGKKETDGKNLAPWINPMPKYFGVPMGSPYCIMGLLYYGVKPLCEKYKLKNPVPMTASTQDFFNRSSHKVASSVKKGDIGILVNRNDSSHGHAFGILEDGVVSFKTIEFNTDPSGGRDGDGVYKRTRTSNGDTSKKYRGSIDVVKWIMEYNKIV